MAELGRLAHTAGAEVVVLDYAVPSWRGLTYPTKKYYPTWLLPEHHPLLDDHVVDAFEELNAVDGRVLQRQAAQNDIRRLDLDARRRLARQVDRGSLRVLGMGVKDVTGGAS